MLYDYLTRLRDRQDRICAASPCRFGSGRDATGCRERPTSGVLACDAGWLERGVRGLAAWLAPAHCAACDAPVATACTFCPECGASPLPPERVALGALAAGAYAPPLSTAIKRMKFARRADLAARLAELLPAPPEARGALVVPVPLHVTRLVSRGFNPAALLARSWCRRLGAELAPEVLWRWRDTPHQSRLSARERAANVDGAFRVRRQALPRDTSASPPGGARHVLLLDDVVTTGATLEACRSALYAAGVVHVTVVALAATPLV